MIETCSCGPKTVQIECLKCTCLFVFSEIKFGINMTHNESMMTSILIIKINEKPMPFGMSFLETS